MQYNFHPLLVHFPLALLTLYSVLEIFRFRVLTRQTWWFPLKAVLVILGTLSLYPTGLAGKYTEDLLRGQIDRHIVGMHSNFAITTTFIFSIIAAVYVFAIIWPSVFRSWANGRLVILLALVGAVALTITGALGGIIVYGVNSEPLATAVYHLLFR